MHGKSLMPVPAAHQRTSTGGFSGTERHCLAREAMNKQAGYPMRAIRTRDYLYIQNLRLTGCQAEMRDCRNSFRVW